MNLWGDVVKGAENVTKVTAAAVGEIPSVSMKSIGAAMNAVQVIGADIAGTPGHVLGQTLPGKPGGPGGRSA